MTELLFDKLNSKPKIIKVTGNNQRSNQHSNLDCRVNNTNSLNLRSYNPRNQNNRNKATTFDTNDKTNE